MTVIDHNTPIPAKSLADINRRNERALKAAENPAWSLDQAELDRAMLCAEVERLAAERDKAVAAVQHTGNAMRKVNAAITQAMRLIAAGDAAEAAAVLGDVAPEAPGDQP